MNGIIQNEGERNSASINGNSNTGNIPNLFDKKLNDLENRINDIEKYNTKEKYPYRKLLIEIFVGTIIFFVFAVLLNAIFDFCISEDSIVLSFVGITATFIVVSNYMQTKEIEKQFDEKVEDIRKEFENIARSVENKIRIEFDEKIKNLIYMIDLKEDIKIEFPSQLIVDLMNDNKYWHAIDICFDLLEKYIKLNDLDNISNIVDCHISQLVGLVKSGGAIIDMPTSDDEYFTEDKRKKWLTIIKKIYTFSSKSREIMIYLTNKKK
jgi:hypothetical protein